MFKRVKQQYEAKIEELKQENERLVALIQDQSKEFEKDEGTIETLKNLVFQLEDENAALKTKVEYYKNLYEVLASVKGENVKGHPDAPKSKVRREIEAIKAGFLPKIRH